MNGDESSPKGEELSQGEAANLSYKKLAGDDPAHLIRRAILLCSILQRDCSQLINPETKNTSISSSVVRGFLRVHEYLHGARSLEAIVKMSDLVNFRHFNAASLPPPDFLHLHVTKDFLKHVNKGQLELPVIEVIAKAYHEAWRKQRVKDGWKYAPERNDDKKEHPWLLPFDDPINKLPEADQELDRALVDSLIPALSEKGYKVVKGKGYEKQAKSQA